MSVRSENPLKRASFTTSGVDVPLGFVTDSAPQAVELILASQPAAVIQRLSPVKTAAGGPA